MNSDDEDYMFDVPDEIADGINLSGVLQEYDDYPTPELTLAPSNDSERLRRQLAIANSECDVARTKVYERDRVIVHLRQKVKSLERHVHQVESDFLTRSIEVESVRSSMSALPSDRQMVSLRQQIADLEIRLKESEDRFACDNVLTADIEQEAQLRAADANAQATAWQKQVEQLQNHISQLHVQLDSERRARTQETRQLQRALLEVSISDETSASVRQASTELQNANRTLSAEVDRLTKLLEATTGQLQTMQAQYAALSDEHQALGITAEGLQGQIRDLTSGETHSSARMFDMERQRLVDESRQIQFNAQQEMFQVRQHYEEQASQHTRELEALRSELQTVREQNEQLHESVRILSAYQEQHANDALNAELLLDEERQKMQTSQSEFEKLLRVSLAEEQSDWLQQHQQQTTRLLAMYNAQHRTELQRVRSDAAVSNALEIARVRQSMSSSQASSIQTEHLSERLSVNSLPRYKDTGSVTSSVASLPSIKAMQLQQQHQHLHEPVVVPVSVPAVVTSTYASTPSVTRSATSETAQLIREQARLTAAAAPLPPASVLVSTSTAAATTGTTAAGSINVLRTSATAPSTDEFRRNIDNMLAALQRNFEYVQKMPLTPTRPLAA
eukprot:TRINITY_DN305_c0_g1_i1.p1 TRINITY_DN305_c0_g1~~TRINITY_DN305_c0_g1_i1.p1  ORF type:complete len:619 (-),score=159.95 TRINITY_DN305_c0_g1_i1:1939-3795(-)